MLTPPKYLAPEVRDLPRRRGRAEPHSSPTPLLLQRPAGALSEPTAPPASPARSSRRGSRGPCPASSPLSPGRAAQRASLSAPKAGPGPSGPAQPRGRLGPRPRRVGRWQGRTQLLSSGLRLRHCPQSGRGAARPPDQQPAQPYLGRAPRSRAVQPEPGARFPGMAGRASRAREGWDPGRRRFWRADRGLQGPPSPRSRLRGATAESGPGRPSGPRTPG